MVMNEPLPWQRYMRITCFIYIFLLTTCSILQAEPADAQILQQRITMGYNNMSVHEIILDLQERTGADFSFTDDLALDKIRITSVHFENETLEKALKTLFGGHPITFEEKAGAIVARRYRQPRPVSGRVTDERGEPLSGATVMVKNQPQRVTTTDNEGNYRINVPDNAESFIVTYLGYKTQEVPIGDSNTVNIILTANMESLEDVVVTGYRVQDRGTVTGAVASVNSADFEDMPVDNLSNALSGRLPGVTISQAAGTPGMVSDIRVRAIGTFNNASPLYVIDGVVRDKFAFDALTPSEVERISVLKDGASASIYGSRAANGVILVATKRGANHPPTLSYQGTVGIQAATRIPESLNAYEHATLINDALAYHYYYNDNFVVPENDVRLYTQDELDYFKDHSWDWVEELWQSPITTQHALNVNGGSDRVRYFLGGSYIYSTASFDNLNYSKFNLRGNIDVDITDHLMASLDLNTDNRLTRGPNWGVNDWKQEDLYKNLVNRPQLIPPYINGQLVGNWTYWSPAAVMDRSVSGTTTRNGLALMPPWL